MLCCFSRHFQNVHQPGLWRVCSILYRQSNHFTIMLSTPSLLLIIDQVITACVAPHADTRCKQRGREREREGEADRGRVGGREGRCGGGRVEPSWESVSTLMSWSTAGFWIAKPVTCRWQLNVKTFGFLFWSVAESHKSCDKFRSVKEPCSLLSDVSFLPASGRQHGSERNDLHLFVTVKGAAILFFSLLHSLPPDCCNWLNVSRH